MGGIGLPYKAKQRPSRRVRKTLDISSIPHAECIGRSGISCQARRSRGSFQAALSLGGIYITAEHRLKSSNNNKATMSDPTARANQTALFRRIRAEIAATAKMLKAMIKSLEDLDDKKADLDKRMERHVENIEPGQLGDINTALLNSMYDEVYKDYLRLLKTGQEVGDSLAEMGHGVLP
jgi:hypothetical protein